ncbi:PAAR domain-containing protein [Neisseriaceae bacterium ESL0693]|nr:PAAR domain-containing protein [Neisseriaceae bacterium ESL0693]
MSVGYFLRVGDKTTCGGQILTGDPIMSWHGKPAAREGDQVSCGRHSGTYQIIGGISHFASMGRRTAGTLDSRSSCPCHAGFIASITDHYIPEAKPDSPATPPQPTTYRARYLCQNDTGEAYIQRHYHLYRQNGERHTGYTDAEGYTEWYELNKDEEIRIHIL